MGNPDLQYNSVPLVRRAKLDTVPYRTARIPGRRASRARTRRPRGRCRGARGRIPGSACLYCTVPRCTVLYLGPVYLYSIVVTFACTVQYYYTFVFRACCGFVGDARTHARESVQLGCITPRRARGEGCVFQFSSITLVLGSVLYCTDARVVCHWNFIPLVQYALYRKVMLEGGLRQRKNGANSNFRKKARRVGDRRAVCVRRGRAPSRALATACCTVRYSTVLYCSSSLRNVRGIPCCTLL